LSGENIDEIHISSAKIKAIKESESLPIATQGVPIDTETNTWCWTKLSKTFSAKNRQYSPKFGNSIPKQTIIMPAHR
jgi:hypothetical protein